MIKRYFTPHDKPATINTVGQDGSLLRSIVIITILHLLVSSALVTRLGQRFNPWLITILKVVVFSFAVFVTLKFA